MAIIQTRICRRASASSRSLRFGAISFAFLPYVFFAACVIPPSTFAQTGNHSPNTRADSSTAGDMPLFTDLQLLDAGISTQSPTPSSDLARLRHLYETDTVRFADADITRLLDAESKLRSEIDDAKILNGAARYIVDVGLDIGLKSLPLKSPAVQIAEAALGDAARKGVQFYFDQRNSSLDARLAAGLKSELSNIPRFGDGDKITVGNVRNYFLEHNDAILGANLRQKLKALGASDIELQEIMGEEIDRLLFVVGLNSRKGDATSSRVSDIEKKLSALTKKRQIEDTSKVAQLLLTQWRLSVDLVALNTWQSNLLGDLKQLNSQQAALLLKAQEIYNLALSHEPPSVQIAAFTQELGTRSPTPEESSYLQGLQARQAVFETMPRITGHLATLSRLASSVGLPSTGAASFTQSFDTVTSVAQNAALGNPLEVFAGLSSLISGQGAQSIEDARHNSIMVGLKVIEANQVKTYELLATVADEVNKAIAQLERLDVHLGMVQLLTRETAERTNGIADCEYVDGTLNSRSQYLLNGEFGSFSMRREHFAHYSPALHRCIDGLRYLFTPSPGVAISELFHQDFDVDANGKPLSFTKALSYAYVVSLIKSYVPSVHNDQDPDQAFSRLVAYSVGQTPLNVINDLVGQLPTASPNIGGVIHGSEQRYLAVRAIERYTALLLRYEPYLLLVSGEKLLDPRDSPSYRNTRAFQEQTASLRNMLEQALKIINTAIAQQELMNASVTLFAIDQEVHSVNRPNTDYCMRAAQIPDSIVLNEGLRRDLVRRFIHDRQDVLDLLNGNAALRANWIRYVELSIYQKDKLAPYRPDVDGNSLRLYNYLPEDQRMVNLLDSHFTRTFFDLQQSLGPNEGCGSMISEAFFPARRGRAVDFYNVDHINIPLNDNTDNFVGFAKTVDVNNNAVNEPRYSGELIALLDLKGRVLDALMQMRGFEGLSDQQIRLAKHLLLSNVNMAGPRPQRTVPVSDPSGKLQ